MLFFQCFNKQTGTVYCLISLNITDRRLALSATSTIPVQQKYYWSQPNTSGSAGIKTPQYPVKWLSLLRPRWTDSCCTPWSTVTPSYVAVGQLCSVRQAAADPSSPRTSLSSLTLRDGKMDKRGKNGDRKAICQLHKFLCLRYLGHGECEPLFRIW